jgi:hypothetical protein
LIVYFLFLAKPKIEAIPIDDDETSSHEEKGEEEDEEEQRDCLFEEE